MQARRPHAHAPYQYKAEQPLARILSATSTNPFHHATIPFPNSPHNHGHGWHQHARRRASGALTPIPPWTPCPAHLDRGRVDGRLLRHEVHAPLALLLLPGLHAKQPHTRAPERSAGPPTRVGSGTCCCARPATPLLPCTDCWRHQKRLQASDLCCSGACCVPPSSAIVPPPTHLQLQRDAAHWPALDALHQMLHSGTHQRAGARDEEQEDRRCTRVCAKSMVGRLEPYRPTHRNSPAVVRLVAPCAGMHMGRTTHVACMMSDNMHANIKLLSSSILLRFRPPARRCSRW